MRLVAAGVVAGVIVGMAAWCGAAQTGALPPVSAQTAPSGGQVIFSRSTDENGQTTTHVGPAAAPAAIQKAAEPAVGDAERQAVRFTDLDLDVRLRTASEQIAVRALVTVRNDGKTALKQIPLQISSTLDWERIRVGGKDGAFSVATLNSDADHTGQLHEAAVALEQPLAPGATVQLDVAYSGVIAISAQRLLVIGAPAEMALHSDWDRIGVRFTGLRGFGNVVWCPVASVPVILGDGARLFDEIGEHKLRLSGARLRLRLTVEFPHGEAPTAAFVDGRAVTLTVTDPDSLNDEVAGVATADSGVSTLGFETPSLFVAVRKPHSGTNLTAYVLPEDEAAVPAWTAAETAVTPFMQGWLGQRPRSPLNLLDLPDPEDAPFEAGPLLATPIRSASPDRLNGILLHALAHAFLDGPASAPRAWLDEGVASFLGTLWMEKQSGREQALGALEAERAALALAEPASPGESSGQPLAAAISPVYYRTKAAYVLWMLRDLVGDSALSAALRALDTGAEADKGGRSAFEKLLEQAGPHKDLAWFFSDWVDADKGLPDLSIDGVFPSAASAGNWLVAVNLSNSGYAAAEVPVTVRSDSASVTQRVMVPARGKAVQRILIQGRPTEAQANDGAVPETQASVHLTRLDPVAAGVTSGSQPGAPQP